MKTKYTPGPWLVGNFDDGIVFGGDAYAVARMIEPIDRRDSKKKSCANATLIAAAPELLEALRELRYACTDKAERMADAAIAKALGMSSNTSSA